MDSSITNGGNNNSTMDVTLTPIKDNKQNQSTSKFQRLKLLKWFKIVSDTLKTYDLIRNNLDIILTLYIQHHNNRQI